MKGIYLIAMLVIITITILAGLYLKTKKGIIALLGLIIGLFTGGCIKEQESYAESSNNKAVKVLNKNTKSREEKIVTTDEWKGLSKLWRRMNQLENEIVKLGDNWQERSKILQKMQDDTNSEITKLSNLQQKALLKNEERQALIDVFQKRVAHLSRLYSGMTCYEPPPPGEGKRMTSRQNIEKQNQLLEDLYKTGKINNDIYDKIKVTIDNDLKILEVKTSPTILKLVMELNKEN